MNATMDSVKVDITAVNTTGIHMSGPLEAVTTEAGAAWHGCGRQPSQHIGGAHTGVQVALSEQSSGKMPLLWRTQYSIEP